MFSFYFWICIIFKLLYNVKDATVKSDSRSFDLHVYRDMLIVPDPVIGKFYSTNSTEQILCT